MLGKNWIPKTAKENHLLSVDTRTLINIKKI